MSLTFALFATLALALPAQGTEDASVWRARSEALYAAGDFRGALEAAQQARALDHADPWARYAWVRALAALDPDAARSALPGLQDPAVLRELPAAERARLETALGYLCLDLGVEPLAAMLFDEVPATEPSHPEAQAGLAILAVRRGHSRQALVHFVAARGTGKPEPSLAELERETRFQVMLQEFNTARNLRDANAAGRAYSVLDELRPNHPSTLRARADLAELRGDAPARERALRDLLAVDRDAPDAASQLVDTLLQQNRPFDALVAARDLAPDRLAGDPVMQAIERNWVSHLEGAVGSRWRNGRTDHDRLELPELQFAWTASHPRFGRLRIAADALAPDSDRVRTGEPFGSLVALPAFSESQGDKGAAALLQWAPNTRVVLELGHTPSAFEISNLTGAVRFRVNSAEGAPWSFGFERAAVVDSLLSFAGAVDPLNGRNWGGVTRNRAYVGGRSDDEDLAVYGLVAASILDGQGVDDNAQWQADAGFWRRAASGPGWIARLGGSLQATSYADNRSHFTLGHGGYFSPSRFLSVGPVFDLRGRREATSFRVEGGLLWQTLREESSEFFPSHDALQTASGSPFYAGESREGLGARLAASMEWRVSDRAVAGLRLEGVRGEDFDVVRLQVYTRRWDRAISEPLREPPSPGLGSESYHLN
ncbi:MAG: cellulose synthase subunit BcsC-related outer membrane protein [Steroidobacteraceae bacterium]